jgi:hypothetical protein
MRYHRFHLHSFPNRSVAMIFIVVILPAPFEPGRANILSHLTVKIMPSLFFTKNP